MYQAFKSQTTARYAQSICAWGVQKACCSLMMMLIEPADFHWLKSMSAAGSLAGHTPLQAVPPLMMCKQELMMSSTGLGTWILNQESAIKGCELL